MKVTPCHRQSPPRELHPAVRDRAQGRALCRYPTGAEASANLYSIIESCAKAASIKPYSYLRQLTTVLPQATAVEYFEALPSWNIDLGLVASMDPPCTKGFSSRLTPRPARLCKTRVNGCKHAGNPVLAKRGTGM